MFDRILIANRGEIACRIIRTARRLGISTIAVYSEADRDALHVRMADKAVPIGPAVASESYLSIPRIIAAGERAGADAVHPGYGFLAENADFAKAVVGAGMVFIGPNPAAIAAMGDKIAAKEAAAKAGVSVVPGHLGIVADEMEASTVAARIGYPVMIKAAAGGGGKGMRIASDAAALGEAFARARSEAKSAFGDERIFIEKYLERPRHIEIQVLGDKFGNVVHLGERECSIQRRNQKIVEESPSPLVDEAMRSRMGAQAAALAKAVGYDSAGTVEFVATNERNFYFLEMNTRLQVEHPVTEFVTGIDLVEQMIRIAAGEKLAFAQEEIKFDGWAVETRVYAEDPSRNFLPSIGRLRRFLPPRLETEEGGIRVDTGVEEGNEISVYYDPLIAKLVTRGRTREEAIARQADALDCFMIDGIRHNVPFLAALMQHRRWRAGDLSTAFLAEEYPNGFHPLAPAGAVARMLASVAAAIDLVLRERKRRISGQENGRPVVDQRARVARLDASEIPLQIDRIGEVMTVRFVADGGEAVHRLESRWQPGEALWRGSYDGSSVSVQVRLVLNGFDLFHRGIETRAHIYSIREAEAARLIPATSSAYAGNKVHCPMPGLVVSVAVVAGQAVKSGEPLAVVEAMKMENVLRADRDGVVKRILVAAGDSLAVDQVILEFA